MNTMESKSHDISFLDAPLRVHGRLLMEPRVSEIRLFGDVARVDVLDDVPRWVRGYIHEFVSSDLKNRTEHLPTDNLEKKMIEEYRRFKILPVLDLNKNRIGKDFACNIRLRSKK